MLALKDQVCIILLSLTRRDSVLQRSFVKYVGGKGAEGRVHSILHLQTDGTDAQHDQTLKQRLGQPSFSRLLTHDHWAELAVVSHQNQLQREASTDGH